jgi:hypothetical protein
MSMLAFSAASILIQLCLQNTLTSEISFFWLFYTMKKKNLFRKVCNREFLTEAVDIASWGMAVFGLEIRRKSGNIVNIDILSLFCLFYSMLAPQHHIYFLARELQEIWSRPESLGSKAQYVGRSLRFYSYTVYRERKSLQKVFSCIFFAYYIL